MGVCEGTVPLDEMLGILQDPGSAVPDNHPEEQQAPTHGRAGMQEAENCRQGTYYCQVHGGSARLAQSIDNFNMALVKTGSRGL